MSTATVEQVPPSLKPLAPATNLFETPNGHVVRIDHPMPPGATQVHARLDDFADGIDVPVTLKSDLPTRVAAKAEKPDVATVAPKKANVAAIVESSFGGNAKWNIDAAVTSLVEQVKVTRTRANFDAFAAHAGDIGNNLQETSRLAVLAGGDAHTWKRVYGAGQGLTTLSDSLKKISSAAPGSLTMVLGCWGAAVGVLTTMLSLFGDNDDDEKGQMFEQIFLALEQIRSALERGFHRLEAILVECVCERLAHISRKLVRIESIMCASFQDLHRKDLLDIADAIKKDMCGEFPQTTAERRALLRRLSAWIDGHCAASIEVSQNRIELDSPTVLLEVLSDDANESIGFLLPLIAALVPDYKPTHATPNLAVCMYASNLFVLADQKWKLLGHWHRVDALYGRVATTLERVQSAVLAIDRSVVDCLLRQVAHYRFLLGRALARAGIDFNSTSGGGKQMREQISATSVGDRDNIMRLLDAMELRRLVLEQTALIAPLDVAQRERIASLQSKAQFLALVPAAVCQISAARGGKQQEILDCLNRGANVNASCGWGAMVLHFPKMSASADHVPLGLHHLLRCDGVQLNNGSTRHLGDTWPVGSRPIQYILNCSLYELALLFVANGYDIDATNYGAHWQGGAWGDCGNLYQWAATPTYYSSVICLQFVHAMADPTSFLHREKLRAAYAFYKQYESGLVAGNYQGNQKSLFTIVCLLGLIPTQQHGVDFSFRFDAPMLLTCGFTFYMLAYRCKNYNVMQFMIDSGKCHNHRQSLNPAHVPENVVVFPPAAAAAAAAAAATAAILPVAAPATEQTEFLRNLQNEKQHFAELAATAAAAQEDRSDTFTQQCRTWIELLTPVCAASNRADVDGTLKTLRGKISAQPPDTAAVVADFNLLNALLKQSDRNYQLGPNVDLFLQTLRAL